MEIRTSIIQYALVSNTVMLYDFLMESESVMCTFPINCESQLLA